MGRLMTRVREAEEKLAAVAKAIHSAWEEELADATAARDAARANLARARAMEQAARAMGREELVLRVKDVVENLESSAGEAEQRLLTLDHVEEELRARLDGRTPVALPAPKPADPPPVPAVPKVEPAPAPVIVPEAREATPPVPKPAIVPPPPAGQEPVKVITRASEKPAESEVSEVSEVSDGELETPSEHVPVIEVADGEEVADDEIEVEHEVPAAVEPGQGELEGDEDGPKTRPIAISRPPVPEDHHEEDSGDTLVAAEPKPPSPKLAELHGRLVQLQGRVDEIAKGSVKWARPISRLAVQEHVALTRLLAQRFDAQDEDGAALTAGCLGQLAEVARTFALEDVVGLGPGETADWNRLATEARQKRVALVEARKAARTRDP